MKKSLLILTFMFSLLCTLSAQDKVVPFNKSLITTGSGTKSHQGWAKFPSKDTKIRKIVLKLTLATPQENHMSCAHWDYVDKLIVKRKDGDYEIARLITPYGGRNPKDWSFTWEVDVTDFAPLLRDSVEFDYLHSGWEPSEDRGWALTTTFEITYGEPTYTPVAIHKVYDGNFKYGFIDNPIEKHLKPYEIELSPKTNYLRSVTFQTGHGCDSLGNSEFTPKWRKLFWNGEEVSHKVLWTEGGDNPLYPQAGTWIYDRGNWIPGMLINPDVWDLMVKGGEKGTFDLNMEPYIMEVKPSANQEICSYLIEYEMNTKANDVEVADIIVPSSKDIHRRKNPSNEYPVIKVKNHSAKPVTSMTIHYYDHTEKWKGEIAPFAVAEIRLQKRVDNTQSEFKVEISSVNGKKDSYPEDNSMSSSYSPVPTHKGNFKIVLKGNNMSEKENTLTLYNVTTGEKIIDYSIGKVTKIERDIDLPNGDYLFEVTDEGGDGLDFWAHKEAGSGECFIVSDKGKLVKYFEPDFGNNIRYWFSVDKSLENENVRKEPLLKITYNETNKPTFHYIVNTKEGLKFVIKSYIGKEVATIECAVSEDPKIEVDMTEYPVGLYFVEVWQNGYKAVYPISVKEIK